jgi:hypothetical protein
MMLRAAYDAPRMIAPMICLLAVFVCAWDPRSIQAGEETSVQDVLSDPTVFHLRQVYLRGTVRNVEPLEPYEIPAGTTCYGGYLFKLEDDTGTISVAVPGLCGIPLVKEPDVDDGARVQVDATIQAPSHGGYTLSFKGRKVVMDQEGIVQAIATRITPLAE